MAAMILCPPGDVHHALVAVVEDVVLDGARGAEDGESFVVGRAGHALGEHLADGGDEEFVVGEGFDDSAEAGAGAFLDNLVAGGGEGVEEVRVLSRFGRLIVASAAGEQQTEENSKRKRTTAGPHYGSVMRSQGCPRWSRTHFLNSLIQVS